MFGAGASLGLPGQNPGKTGAPPKLQAIHIHPASNGFVATHHFSNGGQKHFGFKNPGALKSLATHVAHTAKSVWLGNKTGTRVPMFSKMRHHAQEMDQSGY